MINRLLNYLYQQVSWRIFLIGGLLLLTLTGFQYYTFKKVLLTTNLNWLSIETEKSAQKFSEELRLLIEKTKTLKNSLSSLPVSFENRSEALSPHLSSFALNNKIISLAFVHDKTGKILAMNQIDPLGNPLPALPATARFSLPSHADSSMLLSLLNKDHFILQYFHKDPSFALICPYQTPFLATRLYLTLIIPLNTFRSGFNTEFPGRGQSAYALSESNSLIQIFPQWNAALRPQRWLDSSLVELAGLAPLTKPQRFIVARQSLNTSEYFPGQNWQIFGLINYSILFHELIRFQVVFWVINISVFAIMLLIIFHLIKPALKSLSGLLESIHRIPLLEPLGYSISQNGLSLINLTETLKRIRIHLLEMMAGKPVLDENQRRLCLVPLKSIFQIRSECTRLASPPTSSATTSGYRFIMNEVLTLTKTPLAYSVEKLIEPWQSRIKFSVSGLDQRISREKLQELLDILKLLLDQLQKNFFSSTSTDILPSLQPSLKLDFSLKNNQMRIRLEDNSEGVDPEEIKEQARAHHLILTDQPLSSDQLLDLIPRLQFSPLPALDRLVARYNSIQIVKDRVTMAGGQLHWPPLKGSNQIEIVIPEMTFSLLSLQVQQWENHLLSIEAHGEVVTEEDLQDLTNNLSNLNLSQERQKIILDLSQLRIDHQGLGPALLKWHSELIKTNALLAVQVKPEDLTRFQKNVAIPFPINLFGNSLQALNFLETLFKNQFLVTEITEGLVVQAWGEIDRFFNTHESHEPLLQTPHKYIFFDFKNIHNLSSHALGGIVSLHIKLKQQGKKVAALFVNDRIINIFETTKLSSILSVLNEEKSIEHFLSS